MADIQVPIQAAQVVAAMLDLLGALKHADVPALTELLQSGPARVFWDERERVLMVSVVDPSGRGHSVAVVVADPFDRGGFGQVGIPVAAGDGPPERLH